MKGFVYILKNELGRHYIGSTSDLDRRLYQHKRGTTHSTKRMGSMELVSSQEYETIKLARQIEFKLKRLKRKNFIEKIIKEGYIKIKL
jgi:putative endonuclease